MLCALLLAAASALPAFAETFPSRPLQIVVPYPAGGGSDVLMRAYAEAARKQLTQPVVVVNRPGAIGTIGFDEGARAKPDGHSMTMLAAELLIAPYVKMGRSTYQDFEFVARLNVDPGVVVVKADAPWKSIDEFLAIGRSKPTQVNVATGGYVFRVAMADFEERFGMRFSHVPYQGEGPAVLGLMGDQVDALVASPGAVASFVRSGKLRILGVMDDRRLKKFPDVPTLRERGFDFVAGTWRGLGVPKSTPPEVITALRSITEKVNDDPAYREVAHLQEIGLSFQGPEEFGRFLKQQDSELRRVVPRLDLRK